MPADLGPSGEADAEHPAGPRSDDGPLNGEMPSTSDSAASGPPADGGAALDARIAALGAAYDSRIDAAAPYKPCARTRMPPGTPRMAKTIQAVRATLANSRGRSSGRRTKTIQAAWSLG
jgi:hypothetical protein